jgi:hypothetical protein
MRKVIAYCLAGGILLLVADVAPRVATATTGLILLGVALTHGQQLTAVSNFITQNVNVSRPMTTTKE